MTSNRNSYLGLLLLFLVPFASGLSAQTLAEARKLYDAGRYAEAKPVFERYVKQVPSNGNYNLWYGVCCLQTGDADAAVKPLETAVRKRVPSGQLWLGQAYDRVYRYEDAIKTFEDYTADLKRRRRSTQEADSLMETFRSHLRMLKGVERVCVVDSFVVPKRRFLDAYRLSSQAGTLSLYDERFPRSGKQGKTVYENELGTKVLYSEADAQGRQRLLSSSRLLDEWTPGTPLPGHFPDTVNMAYPYLLSDGVTLYYASDGPESMGGYDIFVTRYNTGDDTYLRPDNIGMPFNSPYNDYMYVVDEYANLGWFASDRHQPADSVCIYVFIPNATKQVYNYEQMDTGKLRSLAALTRLKDTWSDTGLVDEALARLEAIGHAHRDKDGKQGFDFVIDDRRTCHEESDFRSARALQLFRQYEQKQEALKHQKAQLEELRTRYASATDNERAGLRPRIVDLENRVRHLEAETAQAAKQVRNAEIKGS